MCLLIAVRLRLRAAAITAAACDAAPLAAALVAALLDIQRPWRRLLLNHEFAEVVPQGTGGEPGGEDAEVGHCGGIQEALHELQQVLVAGDCARPRVQVVQQRSACEALRRCLCCDCCTHMSARSAAQDKCGNYAAHSQQAGNNSHM